jgi:hypothetical protein
MALFVEVDSVEKSSKVIINLDEVVEIAPLTSGGCALFLAHGVIKVKDNYDQFKQFAMQTVSSDDIAKKVKAIKGTILDIPKL